MAARLGTDLATRFDLSPSESVTPMYFEKCRTVGFAIGLVIILAIGCGDDTEPSNNAAANNTTANNGSNVTTPDMGEEMGSVDMGAIDMGAVDMGEEMGTVDMGDETDIGEPGPTWENSVAAIFAADCVRCHQWAADYDLVILDTSELRDRIAAGHGRLDNDDTETVLEWIDNGSPRD